MTKVSTGVDLPDLGRVILDGSFEIMDIVFVPITPAGGTAEWTTEMAIPKDVKGFYILFSVESKKPRTDVNYALDITDK